MFVSNFLPITHENSPCFSNRRGISSLQTRLVGCPWHSHKAHACRPWRQYWEGFRYSNIQMFKDRKNQHVYIANKKSNRDKLKKICWISCSLTWIWANCPIIFKYMLKLLDLNGSSILGGNSLRITPILGWPYDLPRTSNQKISKNAFDGKNPAPVVMVNIP